MATIINEFFTRLGFELDESALKNAQTKIAGLGKTILGLGVFSGLSVAGIVALTNSTIDSLAAVQSLSDRTGIATESITAMTNAASEFDVPAAGMQSTLEGLNNILGMVMNGNKRAILSFQQLGLQAKTSAGEQKDVVTFLGDIAERIKKMSAGAQQAVLTRLGVDKNLIGMLRNGRDEFNRLYNAARSGSLITPDMTKRAAEMNQVITRLKNQFKDIKDYVAMQLAPTLERMANQFMDWFRSGGRAVLDEFIAGLQGWVTWLNDVIDDIGSLIGSTGDLNTAMDVLGGLVAIVVGYKLADWMRSATQAGVGLVQTLTATAQSLQGAGEAAYWTAKGFSQADAAMKAAQVTEAAMLGYFALIVVAIAAVVAAIWLLYRDFRNWQRGADSMLGRIQKAFPEAFGWVQAALKLLADDFKAFWETLKRLWAQIGPTIMFLGKWLLIIVGILIGVVLAAVVLVVYGIIRYWTMMANVIIAVIEQIKADWTAMVEAIKYAWNNAGAFFTERWEAMKKNWQALTEGIKALWNDAGAFLTERWAATQKNWQAFCDVFLGAWQKLSDGIKGIWSSLMGWLEPFFKRIESVFNFITDSAKALTGSTGPDNLGRPDEKNKPSRPGGRPDEEPGGEGFWKKLGTYFMPAPPLQPAMAGGMVPPVIPASTVNNANRSQVVTNQTDMKVTMNVSGPDPETTANKTVDKLNQQKGSAVRWTQGQKN